MRYSLSIILMFCSFLLQGQYSVTFKLSDTLTHDRIEGASFAIDTNISRTTNYYGYATFKLNKGLHIVQISHIAYEDIVFKINIIKDTSILIFLIPEIFKLRNAKLKTRFIEHKFGINKMTNAAFKLIPSILSEPDPLKAIQLLPGVSNAQEGNTGIYVRGGNLDQTMILYDEAPLYSSMHFLGLFSTFDANAVSSITLYKSAIPAKFGGRGSSVLEAKLKEGSNQNHHQTLEIGLLQSKAAFEGPIIKNKLSYFVSGRFAYPVLLITPKFEKGVKGFTNYFYDLNFKIKADINKNHSVYMSSFQSKDNFSPGDNALLGAILSKNILQNRTATLRWNYIINKALFMNATASYSKYRNKKITDPTSSIYEPDENGISNYIIKSDFDYFLNNKVKLDFGFQSLFYDGITGTRTQYKGNPINPSPKNRGVENSAYFSSNLKTKLRHTFQASIRLSYYLGLKPDRVNFFNLEPRLSYTYKLKNGGIFAAAFDKSTQYQHLISQNLIFFPSDFWANSSVKLHPQKTYSYSLGYQITKRKWQINSECFYKKYTNIFDYIDGALIQNNSDYENQLTKLNARAYGIESSLQKTFFNKLFVNINYTYSRSVRQSDLINNNRWYPANFDRPHMGNIFITKQINKQWAVNGLFIVQSGRPITLLLYPLLYSDRNEYRLPIYHRFDIGFNYCKNPDKKRFKSSWNFSVYNVYNRLNVYGIVWNVSTQKYTSLTYFPIIPSVSYSLVIK